MKMEIWDRNLEMGWEIVVTDFDKGGEIESLAT